MSTEEQRRAARAARLNGTQPPAAAPSQAPGPAESVEPPVRFAEVVGGADEQVEQPDGLVNLHVGEGSAEGVDSAPRTGDDAPDLGEGDDAEVTVRHDGADASSSGGDGGTPAVEGERPVVDDGKAAGEAMRQARAQRGRGTPRHGHGWLDVDAFTDYLRTARLRPIGTGQGTVNVRVSAQLVDALEAYRRELAVSKRDVVEALLVELVGPSMPDGGRR